MRQKSTVQFHPSHCRCARCSGPIVIRRDPGKASHPFPWSLLGGVAVWAAIAIAICAWAL